MSNPRLSQDKMEAIKRELDAGLSARQISAKLGVGIGTVSNVRQGFVVTGELELQRSETKRKELADKYKEALRRIETLSEELDIRQDIEATVPKAPSLVIAPKHGGRGEATPVLCVNDWHSEERVSKSAVNGVNEYNAEIAKRRVKNLWSSAAGLVDMCKTRSKIDTMIVAILGDLITGYIHDELMATNDEPPAAAIMRVYDWVVAGILFLRRETKVGRILVPCLCGNHGRFTQKRWSKNVAGTSLEGMMYDMLVRRFRGDKAITIIPPHGDMTHLSVYGRTLRFMHGDNVRYSGGIGGVHVPLRKALDAWNTQVKADYTYMGHWHTDLTGEDYRVSGSLIGYTEWSLRIKARFARPSQAFELQHPRWGATARFPIMVER
jgi:hypothetical protein